MSEQWFVRRGDIERGPLGLSELKLLVAKGTIAATDLVRNSDQSEWNEVGTVKGLFPSVGTASPAPPPLPSSATHRPPPKSTKAFERVKAGLANLVSTAKQAKDLAATHARKTQITQMLFPKAYLLLGKEVFVSERFRDEFIDLFRQIAAKNDEIAKVTTATKERPQATDLKGKLQTGAAQLMAQGQTTKLGFQRESLVRELGKKAFESHGISAGPADLVTPITSANEEISKLDAQLGQLSSGDKGPLWLRLPLAVLLTVICWPVGMILVWLNPRLARRSKWIWAGLTLAVFFALSLVVPKLRNSDHLAGGASQQAVDVSPSSPRHLDDQDFAKVNYAYDYSKDDISIHSQTKSEVRFHQITDSNSNAKGKWVREHGYVKSNGDFVSHGEFSVWEDEGETQKSVSGRYLHGTPHGVKYEYHSNGKVEAEFPFVHGQMRGVYKSWFPNGQKEVVSHYIDDKLHGRAEGWYENGHKQFENIWINGVLGDHDEWHVNGKKKEEHRRKHGLLEGPFREWYENGQLSREEYNRKNMLYGQYKLLFRDGTIKASGQFGENGPSGQWVRGYGDVGCLQGLRCEVCRGTPYSVTVNADKWNGGSKEQLLTLFLVISTVKSSNGSFPGVSANGIFPPHCRLNVTISRSTFQQVVGPPDFILPKDSAVPKSYGYKCSDGVLWVEGSINLPRGHTHLPVSIHYNPPLR